MWQVFVLPGDSVAAYDSGQWPLTVFTPSAFAVAYTLTFAATAPQFGRPNGVLLLPRQRKNVARYVRPFTRGHDPRSDYSPEQVVHVLNWDGTHARTSTLTLAVPQSLVTRHGGTVGIAPFPFGWSAGLALGPRGDLYYGRGDSLHIEVFDLTGRRPARTRNRTRRPRSPTGTWRGQLRR